jgi:hypothetical protein
MGDPVWTGECSTAAWMDSVQSGIETRTRCNPSSLFPCSLTWEEESRTQEPPPSERLFQFSVARVLRLHARDLYVAHSF